MLFRSMAYVRALEVAGEGLDQVVLVGDLPRRQVLQLGTSGVGEEQGEIADDEVIVVRSTQLAGQPIVHEPQFRSRLPRVLCDSSRGSEPGREWCPSYGAAESLRTGWFGRRTPILPAVPRGARVGVAHRRREETWRLPVRPLEAVLRVPCATMYGKLRRSRRLDAVQSGCTALSIVKQDRKSTRLNSSHSGESRMPSSA